MKKRIPVPNTFEPVDEFVDEAWNALRGHPVIDRLFYGASEAANFSRIWHAIGLAQAIALRDPKRAIRASAALGLEAALVNGPIKSLFERERPDVSAEDRPLNLRQPKTSSFPSGHASAAVVAASFLTPGMPWLVRVTIQLLATIVATSRIHVQIHHATDVAAGGVTGWVLAKLARAILNRTPLA